MTPVISFLSTPAMQSLAWTLVHFLWQGTLLAIAAAVVMRWAVTSARTRYVVGCIALAVMLATPVATFLVLQATSPVDASTSDKASPVESVNPGRADVIIDVAGGLPSEPAMSGRALPAVVLLWLSGVLLLSARLLGGWAVARQLAVTTRQPVSADVEALAIRVADRLGLRQLVRVVESSAVTVPIVIGWLKPVVLVPTAAVAGLSPAHLEALLAHELAHVRRHDYLVNLFQSAIETLLFYHPAVWWVSSRVRQEREHCCDDEAVAVCDRFVYVNALTDLAAMTMHARLALAATDGSLLRRIRRLLAHEAEQRPAAGWASVGIVVIVLAALTPVVVALGAGDQATAPPPAATATAVADPGSNPPRSVPVPASLTSSLSPGPVAPAPGSLVPAVDQEADAAAQRTRELRQGLDALARRLSERETDLARLASQERQIDDERAQADLRLRREAAMEQLAAVQRELQRAVRQYEIGVAREEVVNQARAQVASAERELRSIDVESMWSELRRRVDAQRAEAELDRVRLQQEYAAAAARARRALEDARTKFSESHPDVVRLAAQVRSLEDATRSFEAAAAAEAAKRDAPSFPLSDPAAQVRAGDLLVVDIAGEDQLPKWYVVNTNGAIRFPLIGPLKVVDFTAVQVRDAVARALAERKLAEGRAVTVVIHRQK